MFKKILLKNLLREVIEHERIKTTEARAKKVRSLVDRVIKRAKEEKTSYRYLLSLLPKKLAEKLIKEIAPRFPERKSGFTRIIKLGKRAGDNAPMVLLELVTPKTQRRKEAVTPEEKKPATEDNL